MTSLPFGDDGWDLVEREMTPFGERVVTEFWKCRRCGREIAKGAPLARVRCGCGQEAAER